MIWPLCWIDYVSAIKLMIVYLASHGSYPPKWTNFLWTTSKFVVELQALSLIKVSKSILHKSLLSRQLRITKKNPYLNHFDTVVNNSKSFDWLFSFIINDLFKMQENHYVLNPLIRHLIYRYGNIKTPERTLIFCFIQT